MISTEQAASCSFLTQFLIVQDTNKTTTIQTSNNLTYCPECKGYAFKGVDGVNGEKEIHTYGGIVYKNVTCKQCKTLYSSITVEDK